MSLIEQHAGVSTLIGTPKEVKTRLGKSQANQVLVVSFDNISNLRVLSTLTENISTVASTMFEVFKERQEKQSLEILVGSMLPKAPASPHLMKEAAMLLQARKAVLESGNWLTAADVSQLAGLSTTNPSAQPNKWKKSGQIFAIHHNGIDYFPDYGLDRNTQFRPLKALSEVLKIFADHKDGWGIAFWFLSVNSFLGGQRPQDMLAKHSERVIEAARDEIEGVGHG
ncbi:hypothetical protein [Pantoea sp. Taur]|jgi:hypothetical protein|uniref:hypothetical protein n=1 Tax=Pantoea sp. Taur TaxID=2576757 RepID=UPI001352F09C|nr:hypothetical protein [Pantoea sp. Taur]MXP57139.1 hypothetical protein [Pantoea sp. Taur]